MTNNKKPHLLLNNKVISIDRFPKRPMPPGDKKEEEEEIEIKDYQPKKASLTNSLKNFREKRQERRDKRSLDLPTHIEYVRIYFHGVFNHDLKKKFNTQYGIIPVRYEIFNKTVLFAIQNQQSFQQFIHHLEFFINTPDNFNPLGTEYFLLVHIDKFEFFGSDKIVHGYSSSLVTLEMLDSVEMMHEMNSILGELNNLLGEIKQENPQFEYRIREEYAYIDLVNIPKNWVELIADNFDIFYKVQSHTYKVGPSRVKKVKRREDFEIVPNEKAPLVGIIDTGISKNSVLRDIITDYSLDIANKENPLAIFDAEGHGTSIACIAALGKDFYETQSEKYQASANVVPIKVLNSKEGQYSLSDFESAIRQAAKQNVRIFNLSVTSNAIKFYNDPVSEFAYLLDRLAHELDVLFFIATGNLDHKDMQEMQNHEHSLHRYPTHFYYPDSSSEQHLCENTNIHTPAESYNNVTVGAIAENLNENDSDLTYDKQLPAYYTRKYHLDYSKKINGFYIPKTLINRNLYKPDLVFAGGDALETEAGIEVLSISPGILTENTYGTSNATPFVTHLAARILTEYPGLQMQTVKALLINAANLDYNSDFLQVQMDALKERLMNELDEDLTEKRKKQFLSQLFNKDRLLKYLTGHGVPDQNSAIYSDNNTVSLVLEDKIRADSHKGLFFYLPKYLKDLKKKPNKKIVRITATLCYSCDPVLNNSLAYCPVHISFALFKPLDNDLAKSIDVIAGYTQKEKDNDPIKRRLANMSKEKAFKAGIRWSDDYSPTEKKPFANTQRISFPVSLNDLTTIDNTLNLVVRCVHKKDIDQTILNKIKGQEHKFSLVIRIEEQKINNKLSNQLYDQIVAENDVEAIQDIDLELNV